MKLCSFQWTQILFVIFAIQILSFNAECSDECIYNFGEIRCGNFILTNNVIIKSRLSKEELQGLLGKSLTQLASLTNSNLYMVHSERPIEYAKQIGEMDSIDYAQPDIIQNRQYSNETSQINLQGDELGLTHNSGLGVRIAIIDDGFNFHHEDLQGIDILFTYDADNKNLNASNKLPIDNHGTPMAGIIFARHNEIGIDGVAPNASLIAIRQTLNRTSNTILSFTVAAKAGADVINCSWNSPILMEPVYDVITDLSKNGRRGKGTVIVFAAGNDGKELKHLSVEAAIPDVITVGTISPSSNYGSVVDVISPTGFISTRTNGKYQNFSGTSAASAFVSGKLSLLIEQNPESETKELLSILKGNLTP